VIAPPRCTRPVPFCVKAPPPFSVMLLPPVTVTRPEFVTVSGPPFVVVMAPLVVKLLPVRIMPLLVFVSREPESVAVPVDESTRIAAAVTDWMEISCALVTITVPTRGVPIVLDSVISPAPAVNVKLKAPPTVLDSVMLPPPEFSTTPFVSVIGEAKERRPAVVTLAPSETVPAVPDSEKVVAEVIGAAPLVVRRPVCVILIALLVEVTL